MITAQSTNFQTILDRDGKRPILQAFFDGVADVACSERVLDGYTPTYALDLDGTNDYVDLGSNAAIAQLADWTVCAWIKRDSSANSGIVGSWDNAASRGWMLTCLGAAGIGYRYTGITGGATRQLIPSGIGTGAWHYVALSVGGRLGTVVRAIGDTTEYTEYMQDARTARDTWTASTAVKIGTWNDGADRYFDGRIGYVAIFNRALTHQEMRRVKYRSLNAAWGNDDSTGLWDCLVAQYDFRRGSGTTLTNTKAPGTHNGTLTNGPTWQSDPAFVVTYHDVLAVEGTIAQEVEALATKTSISSLTLRLLDRDAWFTDALATTDLGIFRRDVRLHLGFWGLQSSEFQPVFQGKVQDCATAGRAYTIKVGDALFDGKKRLGIAKTVIPAGSGILSTDTIMGVPLGTWWWNSNDPSLAVGPSGYLKADDEIIGFPGDTQSIGNGVMELGDPSGGGTSEELTRGQFGTSAAAHPAGTVLQEYWLLEDGVHPLTHVLRLLLSGAGFEGSSSHDALTEFSYETDGSSTRSRRGRGLALAPSDVSTADIEALRDADFSGYAFRLFLTETTQDAKDWIETQLLRPCGCYFFTRADGRLGIASHKVPVLGDSVASLEPSDVQRCEWRVDQGDIVNWLEIEYDWNPATDEFDGQFIDVDATSGATYGIRKKEYQLRGVDAAHASYSTILNALAADILARFKDPLVTIELTAPLSLLFLEIGDAVTLTDFNLPDVTNGRRGVHAVLCQIVGRKVDLRRGQVSLTLVDVSRM